MSEKTILGIDMGGTNVRGGIVRGQYLSDVITQKINARGSEEEVKEELFYLIDLFISNNIHAIGIGVPGLIDEQAAMVYDVVNIPSWKKLPLKRWIQDRYSLPVEINNDANCFALGEFYFGKGKSVSSMIGTTIGTGLGSGIIINDKIYTGRNGGAGEFGMAPYLDQCYEYYASGQFFDNVYGTPGEVVFTKAKAGEESALSQYAEMGMHLGNAVKMMLFALDVELIVFGGSVRHAWPYFQEAMWKQIKTFPFTRVLEHLKIEVSELNNAGILGAAALHYHSVD
ncbi:ROK family protein [soil metagenome]